MPKFKLDHRWFWRWLVFGSALISVADTGPELANSEGLRTPTFTGAICPSLAGQYVFEGQALPGLPSYFRLMSRSLTMDAMLGIMPIDRGELGKGIVVNISESESLEFSFLIQGQELHRAVPYEKQDTVLCLEDAVIIRKVRTGVGEATRGTVGIIHTLSLDEKKALIVRTEIRSTSTFLFFFEYSNPPEIYGARFHRTDE